MNPYKRFAQAWLVSAICFSSAILLFNYYLDPNNRYHFKANPADLSVLANSHEYVLVTPGNFDDRSFLKSFIQAAPVRTTVAIGGSRIMNFEPDAAEQFLNAGVSAGSIKDYIAIWQIMKDSKKIPQKIFICIDPQSLNKMQQNTRWLAIAEYYHSFFKSGLSIRYSIAALTSQLKDLLSLQTTLAALKQLCKRHLQPKLTLKSEYDGKEAARRSSFALIYPAGYEDRASAEVEILARANGNGEAGAFNSWNMEDQEPFNRLSMLLGDMQKNKAQVILVLMPTHPLSLNVVKQDQKAAANLTLFRVQLAEAAITLNVPFYDGFNDTEVGLLHNQDFSDGVHLKTTPNKAFFERVRRSLKLNSF